MFTPAEEHYDQSASDFFLKFKGQLNRYSAWYGRIKETQTAVARGIDALDEPYTERQRRMRALELCTRLLILQRRACGFGLLISAVLNLVLFSNLHVIFMAWFPTLPFWMAGVFVGVVRVGLLWTIEVCTTRLISRGGWFSAQLSIICQDAEIADRAQPQFLQDLALIGMGSPDNSAAAAYLDHHVRSHRPS